MIVINFISILMSAIIVLVLFLLLFLLSGKDYSWFLSLKIEKSAILLIAGIILLVFMEQWVVQIFSSLLN